MSYYNRPAIQGRCPWPATSSAEVPQEETAPRTTVTYHCPRGHERDIPFAAGVKPPSAWDCRCGQTAYLDGVPQDAAVSLPGYTRPGENHPDRSADVAPMAQLLKRRTKAEGRRLLAERMAEVREGGWSR